LLLGALYGAEYVLLTAIVLALDGWLTSGLARQRWLAGLLALVSAGSLLWLPRTRPVVEPARTEVILAVVAVGRHLAEATWWMLSNNERYKEPSRTVHARQSAKGV
jgi:hypothetical protein